MNAINLAAGRITGRMDTVFLGVEPILFGLFCLGFDLLLLQLKHALGRAFHGTARKNAK